ncbi:RHS repeat-associated core domain-containing protein [Salinactinospora qingdaonensis]|uniref:Teneurin-like YD-shell domain-containing protein n=1 Tax=Salinactinospora qingdaonensis TaxID=702744 RepID=A0ABP7FDQ6_9ACTN
MDRFLEKNDGTLHWVFSDHHQSGQLVVNAASGDTTRRRFTAFGEERSSTGSWPSDRGFVDGTVDASTGLTQLGARAYDANIGRFISVDPVMDLSDPQQMHGYAYANNNPTSFTDPDGEWLFSITAMVHTVVQAYNYVKSVYNGSTTTDHSNNSGSGDARGSGAHHPPIGYGSSSSSGGSSGGSSNYGAVDHDPYDGPSTDPKADALNKAESSQDEQNWWDSAWDGVQDFGSAINDEDHLLGKAFSLCADWAFTWLGAACGATQAAGYAVNGEYKKAAGATAGAVAGAVGGPIFGKMAKKATAKIISDDAVLGLSERGARRQRVWGKRLMDRSADLHTMAVSNATGTHVTQELGAQPSQTSPYLFLDPSEIKIRL